MSARRRGSGRAGMPGGRPSSGQGMRLPTPEALERRRVEAARLALCRQIAADLDAIEPAWHVMFGPGCREFVAFALWDPGAPLALSDTDPHHLLAQMRDAERQSPRTGTEGNRQAAPLRTGTSRPAAPRTEANRQSAPPRTGTSRPATPPSTEANRQSAPPRTGAGRPVRAAAPVCGGADRGTRLTRADVNRLVAVARADMSAVASPAWRIGGDAGAGASPYNRRPRADHGRRFDGQFSAGN